MGNDDFRAMEEVVGRRYRGCGREGGRSPTWS
jgi:excinuclease UvrABC nuclease subunit